MLFLTNGFHFGHAKNSGSQETRNNKVLQEKPVLSVVVLVHLAGKQPSTSKHSVFQQDR